LNIQLISISLTNKNEQTLESYLQSVTRLFHQENGPAVFVLPEYCWGDISSELLQRAVEYMQKELSDQQFAVLGSYPIEHNGIFHNCAIVVDRERIIKYIPKTHVLADESRRNGVVSGTNPGIVTINGIHVAIIICADIWDNRLLNRLLWEQNADILLVPAFTVVPPQLKDYAKVQWQALGIVRSREYLLPVVIADHSKSTDRYGVGNATCIVDPSRKNADLKVMKDFLQLPTNNRARLTIQWDDIKAYREYRIQKGLYQKKSSSDN